MVRKCVICKVLFKKGEQRSFHRFPKNLERRNLWKLSLGDVNITDNIFVCSDHFAINDFLTKPSGIKYLRETAIPVIASTYSRSDSPNKENIPLNDVPTEQSLHLPQQKPENVSTCSSSSTLSAQSGLLSTTNKATDLSEIDLEFSDTSPKHSSSTLTVSEIGMDSPNRNKIINVKKRPYPRYFGECHTSDMDSPKRARKNWSICKKKIKMQTIKIRNLQQAKSRLKARICNLNSLLKFLKKRYDLTETAQCIIHESAPGMLGEICQRSRKGQSRKKYSPELRSFALTLSFYSTDAYNYVRRSFNMALPHTKTISKWYRSIDGTPGFTNEALAAIKMKVRETNSEILGNLVFDEMSIMQRVEWNGKRFTGYVDVGTEVYGDNIPEATEALVFMVVAINSHWKIPVGYFLTNGLSGGEKANLLKKCLEFLSESGVKIVSVTFDGAPSNINMCKILGAKLDDPNNLKPFFFHPLTKEKIFLIFDICHMLKLLRNCLGDNQKLFTQDGKIISWDYLQKLVDLQVTEGLQAATKLKKRHLNWHREKMKVSLAAQTFSNSVADALLYLSEDIKHPNFENATTTSEFIKIINNLFDIFNSHNKYSKSTYKRALSKDNSNELFAYLEFCKSYIKNLTLLGKPVLSTKRKIRFLGFLVGIESLKGIYEKYVVEANFINFITTYKLSQDHLELFFSAVRRKGGSNNNPTARQFEYIYKRLLVHAEIKGSSNANAIPLDNTSIMYVSSVTQTTLGENLEESEEFIKFFEMIMQMDFLNSNSWHLTTYVSDIVAYISGFVVKCVKKCVTCSDCLHILENDKPLSLLQSRKRYGNLINASQFVIDVCNSAELSLRIFQSKFNICGTKNIKSILINKTIQGLQRKTYELFGDHIFEGEPLNNHCMQLIKLVLNKYFDVRIHHEAAKLKDSVTDRVRSTLTKTILFKNQ